MKSYFEEFISVVNTKLPFVIDEFTWDGILVHISGLGWKFNGFTDWVITDNRIMLKGCHDDGVEEYISGLIGKRILAITHASDFPVFDPIFVLEGDLRIKFFSTVYLDPWTFRIDSHPITYVASPSDFDWNWVENSGSSLESKLS